MNKQLTNNEEILKAVIEKAIKNGWKELPPIVVTWTRNSQKEKKGKHKGEYLGVPRGIRSIYETIFNHDFAKALWGEEWPKEMDVHGNFPYYEMRLTQLVLAEDKFKYLKQFI